MSKGVAALVIMLVAGFVVGCGGSDSASDGDSVKVGFIGPLTGEYAVYGQSSVNAAELAISEWNEDGGIDGKSIELVRGDSQGDPKQAATLARQFIDDGVTAVIGPTFTLEAETAVPVLCSGGAVAVTGLANPLTEGDSACYFQTSPRADHAAEYGASVLTDTVGAKTVAIIDDGTADQRDTARLVQESLQGKAEVVFSGSITPGSLNYAPTLTKIKSLDPDGIFIATYDPETGTLRKQGTELGVESGWVATVGNINDQFKERAGAGGISTYSYIPEQTAAFEDFRTAYQAMFNDAPGELNEYTYDAANVLFTAMKDAESFDQADVVEALRGLTDYSGTTGPIEFDEAGSRGEETFETQEYGEGEVWKTVS
jgi:branched-chain amino acid transport system substrate-binding protein